MKLKLIKLSAIIFAFAAISSFPVSAEVGGFDVNLSESNIVNAVQWHGYYEFEFWSTEKQNDTFDAHKVVAWMGIPINEKVFLSSELEYEHFPRLEDSGTQKTGGSGVIKLDSAQLRVTPIDSSVIYMGVFYVPFGIEYLSYPGQKNKLITRPKVMKDGNVIPGTWSDVGVGFNQKVLGLGEVDFVIVNGDANNGGIARDSKTGGNVSKSLGGRVMLNSVIEGVNIGGSFIKGKYDVEGTNDSIRIGGHLRVDLDKVLSTDTAPVLLGEFVSGKDEDDSSVAGKDRNVSGYYFQVSSKVHPIVELAARYGQFDSDTEKADNQKSETSVGFTLNLYENFLVKGEYQWNEEKGANKSDNNNMVLQVVAHW